ncbi:Fe-S biogenesis protein NfuA [Pleionea sediminis]|uniref:Fe-S biogenesis protein NfuA n=1 Tax=Pleionea sediminis TaxID=2569479 RepID=UPI0013DDE751
MIDITPSAQEHFRKLLSQQDDPNVNIRVFVVNPGTPHAECGVSYCPKDAVEETDVEFSYEGFSAFIDKESEPYLEDALIDYQTDKMGGQLTLKAPNAKVRKVADDAPVEDRLIYIIESEINPQLANHGGKVNLVEFTKEGYAILQFGGGCQGCGMVDVTLKEGIEKSLIEKIPELKGVRDITEHSEGENPYY